MESRPAQPREWFMDAVFKYAAPPGPRLGVELHGDDNASNVESSSPLQPPPPFFSLAPFLHEAAAQQDDVRAALVAADEAISSIARAQEALSHAALQLVSSLAGHFPSFGAQELSGGASLVVPEETIQQLLREAEHVPEPGARLDAVLARVAELRASIPFASEAELASRRARVEDLLRACEVAWKEHMKLEDEVDEANVEVKKARRRGAGEREMEGLQAKEQAVRGRSREKLALVFAAESEVRKLAMTSDVGVSFREQDKGVEADALRGGASSASGNEADDDANAGLASCDFPDLYDAVARLRANDNSEGRASAALREEFARRNLLLPGSVDMLLSLIHI